LLILALAMEGTTSKKHARKVLRGILTDVCAAFARIILLAPPEWQKEMGDLLLREIKGIVEQVPGAPFFRQMATA
jgi:hypothetical protein